MIFDIFLCQIWTSLISYAVCQIFLANNFVLKVKNKEKKRMVAKTGRWRMTLVESARDTSSSKLSQVYCYKYYTYRSKLASQIIILISLI